MMRIACSTRMDAHPGWTLWRTGDHLTVIRCTDQSIIPDGYRLVDRGDFLPLSDAERQKISSIAKKMIEKGIYAGLSMDDVLALGEDSWRCERGDPSHDYLCWIAPLRCNPRDAINEWESAHCMINTQYSHVVIRPCATAIGWLCWIGLGNNMRVIAPSGWRQTTRNTRRRRNPDTHVRERICPPARWPDRQSAIDAGVKEIRRLRMKLNGFLQDWEEEGREYFLSGRSTNRLQVFSGKSYSLEILIHEDAAISDPVSWDLPIVERVGAFQSCTPD